MFMGLGLIVIFTALAAAGWFFGRAPVEKPQPRILSARDIAASRYANGEIDKKQFLAIISTLDGSTENK